MSKIIRYRTRYLDPSIVSQCFQPSQYNFVDKTLTGNGFTHSFLHIPVPIGKTNIIIVPNRQVVISKQESYNGDNRVGFIYGGDDSDSIDFNKYDILCFVIDSFVNSIDKLLANAHRMHWMLEDETHTTIIQSPFRHKLRGFTDFVNDNFPNASRVSVTATPLLFQKVDIRIVPETVESRAIHITKHQPRTLNRIKEFLADGKKCVIALQDARLLKGLVDSGDVLKARFKTGKTLFAKILETVKIEEDEDSNLTIISSAGFEGFDVENGINNVFIFEDRSRDYSTYFVQNIVQIIGRPRQGTDYIEWCVFGNEKRTEIKDLEDLKRQAKSTRISHEKKLTSNDYKALRKYSTIEQDKRLGLITEIIIDENLYNLDKEKFEADLNGLGAYEDFFNTRGFTLIDKRNEGAKRSSLKNSSHKQAHKTVQSNIEIVEESGIFDRVELDLFPKESLSGYQRAYEIYLRRKYWDAPVLAWDNDLLPEDVVNTMKLERELFCLAILKDEKEIEKGIKYVTKMKKQQKQDELGRNSKDYKEWLIDFEMSILNVYPRLLMAISQGSVKIPSKMRNSRDFNLTTETSIELIEAVADLFDVKFKETDIVSCNIRIIYAFLGLSLPKDIYGKDKVNKKKINTLLNTLSKHQALTRKIDSAYYKKDQVKAMRGFGFDEKVIEFLISEFWERPKDALYNFCAYHEKAICNSLMQSLIQYAEVNNLETRFVRRHDSILTFGEWHTDFDTVIDNFTYLGKGDWFLKSDGYVDTTKADEVFEDTDLNFAEVVWLDNLLADNKSRESDLNSVKNQVIPINKRTQLEIELSNEYKLKTG